MQFLIDIFFLSIENAFMALGQRIPVLQRSVALLTAVAAAPDGVGAKQLSLDLGIPQATCYRIIRTLVECDWLQECGAGDYRTGFGLALVARSWSDVEQRLRELRPFLHELADETGLSAKISVREGCHAVSVARMEALRANSISSPVGAKIPLTAAGSVGVMLMASASEAELRVILRGEPPEQKRRITREVARAAKEGMARSYGKHHPSIHAVSIPVDVGQPGALTLVGWPEDLPPGRRKSIEARLKQFNTRSTPSDAKRGTALASGNRRRVC
jgi:DNA-binding IclR family transcriptional regulator